jgi:hypothetical protein
MGKHKARHSDQEESGKRAKYDNGEGIRQAEEMETPQKSSQNNGKPYFEISSINSPVGTEIINTKSAQAESGDLGASPSLENCAEHSITDSGLLVGKTQHQEKTKFMITNAEILKTPQEVRTSVPSEKSKKSKTTKTECKQRSRPSHRKPSTKPNSIKKINPKSTHKTTPQSVYVRE